MPILLVSANCSASMRLLDIVARTPSMQSSLQVVDVADASPGLLAGIQAVPSVKFEDGRCITGTETFSWAKGFEVDMKLDAGADFLGDGMLYSSLEGGTGHAQRSNGWGDFS